MEVSACFCDSMLKSSEASNSAVFQSSITSNRKNIGLVTSYLEPTGIKVRGKFGNSRSSSSRDIGLSHFVTNDNEAGRRPVCQGKRERFLKYQ